jgi:TPR repeat protein
MGLIWNLMALAKNAKETLGTVQKVQGQAVQGYGMLQRFQSSLVQKDYERAMAGSRQAQFEMGERFFQGLGVARDYEEAAIWFKLSANQGHSRAQYFLAMMCFLGRGLAPDPAEAYKWIYLAAASREESVLNTKQKIASRISPDAMAEGEKRAAAMKLSAGPLPPQNNQTNL